MQEKWYHALNRCFSDISEFRLYCGDIAAGTVRAHIVPAFPVMMHCGDLCLSYKRDPDITLVSGISIPIMDANCGEEFGRVFWDGIGRHRLHTPYGHFRVQYHNDEYTFSRSGSHVATALRFPDKSEYRQLCSAAHAAELEESWEPYRFLQTGEEIPPELALLMQCFSLLAIGP